MPPFACVIEISDHTPIRCCQALWIIRSFPNRFPQSHLRCFLSSTKRGHSIEPDSLNNMVFFLSGSSISLSAICLTPLLLPYSFPFPLWILKEWCYCRTGIINHVAVQCFNNDPSEVTGTLISGSSMVYYIRCIQDWGYHTCIWHLFLETLNLLISSIS